MERLRASAESKPLPPPEASTSFGKARCRAAPQTNLRVTLNTRSCGRRCGSGPCYGITCGLTATCSSFSMLLPMESASCRPCIMRCGRSRRGVDSPSCRCRTGRSSACTRLQPTHAHCAATHVRPGGHVSSQVGEDWLCAAGGVNLREGEAERAHLELLSARWLLQMRSPKGRALCNTVNLAPSGDQNLMMDVPSRGFTIRLTDKCSRAL